jgi:hypothetical protein
MKVYRQHRCTKMHRTERTFMECAIPRAAWVKGEGSFALIAWCRVPTVWLFSTVEEAEAHQRGIDRSGCGGMCNREHEIVRVVLPLRR